MRSSIFWDVRQHRMVTLPTFRDNLSGLIFNGQTVNTNGEALTANTPTLKFALAFTYSSNPLQPICVKERRVTAKVSVFSWAI